MQTLDLHPRCSLGKRMLHSAFSKFSQVPSNMAILQSRRTCDPRYHLEVKYIQIDQELRLYSIAGLSLKPQVAVAIDHFLSIQATDRHRGQRFDLDSEMKDVNIAYRFFPDYNSPRPRNTQQLLPKELIAFPCS